jgi:hypothetical protein
MIMAMRMATLVIVGCCIARINCAQKCRKLIALIIALKSVANLHKMEIAAKSKNRGNLYLNVAKIHRINDTFDDEIRLECCQ